MSAPLEILSSYGQKVSSYKVFMSLISGVRPSPVVMVSLKAPPPGTMGNTCS